MKVLIFLATVLAIPYSQCMVTEVVVESGSVAVLPCVVHSPEAYSTAVYWKKITAGVQKTVWRRDKSGLEFRPVGQALRAHCPLPNFVKGDYSLRIEAVREEDAGMFLCSVEGTRQDQVQVLLRVIKVSFNPKEATEGEKVQMTCNITPKLPQSLFRVEWKLNGSVMRTATTSQTNTIDHVSQREAGNWSCLVQFRQGQAMASALLQVKGVVFPKDNTAVVYGEVGSAITLPCIFSDGLFRNSVSWKKVSSRVGSPASLPWTPGPLIKDRSMQWDWSGHIRSVQEADEGSYSCSGLMEGATNRPVIVKRIIELVTAQAVQSSKSDTVTLTCHLSNASQVTDYEWLSSTYDSNAIQKLTPVQNSSSNILRIPNADNLGEWVCRYYNQQRLLGNVTFQGQMMSGLSGEKEPVRGKKAAIVLGLGFVLLLVFLILFQMYRNHRRRKQIMQYPAMETIVHKAANERERKNRIKERGKESSGTHVGDLKQEVV